MDAVVTPEIINYVRSQMPDQMVVFFAKVKEHHSRVSAVISSRAYNYYVEGEDCPPRKPLSRPRSPIPHPIHFREGAMVRNWMRDSGLCDHFTDHDLDDKWVEVVEAILEESNDEE